MSRMSDVTSLNDLLQGSVPLIAVSFSDSLADYDLDQAQGDGLDVAEIRIDRFSSFDHHYVLEQVRRFSRFPTIGTIRTQNEGGDWPGSEEQRLDLFKLIVPEVDGIDIELSSMSILPQIVAAARAKGKVVLISNHNFESTPPAATLESMVQRAKDLGADYVKISAMAKSPEDVRTLAQFTLDNTAKGLIVIAMGGYGTVSRIFFPALGSRLTYAFAGQSPVPGQLSYQETFDSMRTFFPTFNEKKIVSMQILEDA